MALLEKAFAKFCGSYKQLSTIEGGLSGSGCRCLEVHGTHSPIITVLLTVLITVLMTILGHLRGL